LIGIISWKNKPMSETIRFLNRLKSGLSLDAFIHETFRTERMHFHDDHDVSDRAGRNANRNGDAILCASLARSPLQPVYLIPILLPKIQLPLLSNPLLPNSHVIPPNPLSQPSNIHTFTLLRPFKHEMSSKQMCMFQRFHRSKSFSVSREFKERESSRRLSACGCYSRFTWQSN